MASRKLYQIAKEIRQDWKKIYFGAEPYLDIMHKLESINEMYWCDSGRTIVIYFLSNANTWRGETARRIKNELKDLLNEK